MSVFASDTCAPAHPHVLELLAEANLGSASSYGADEMTAAAKGLLRDVFETDLEVVFVAGGTAANALALSILCPPTGAVICHRESHIERDERGAIEFFTHGGRLQLLDGEHARLSPDTLTRHLAGQDRSFVHETPAHVLSLTNLTECGTVYQPEDIAGLTDIAHIAGCTAHLDGARLANALATTGATPAQMTWQAGVDVATLGLTKTGAMGCEAILLFGEARAHLADLQARAKRGGHLPPKQRFIAAQAVALLRDDLWLDLAAAANRAARLLAGALGDAGITLAHPVEGNEVFAHVPDVLADRLQDEGLGGYRWTDGSMRFVASWNTPDEAVQAVTDCLS